MFFACHPCGTIRRASAKKFGWSAPEANEAADWISRISDNVEPTQPVDVIKDDPPDNRILECAAAANSDYIISGDKHLPRLKNFSGQPILPVSGFLRVLEARGRR